MSGAKVKFEEADKAKGKNDIPTQIAPDAIAMGGGKDGADRSQAEFKDVPLRDPTATDEQYPTNKLTKSSPEDVLFAEKLQLQKASQAAGTPGVTPFGVLVADDDDFKKLNSLRDQEAEANFQQWFATNFDKMSPVQKAYARELWPDFYQQRLSLLDKDLDLLKKIAQNNIMGIKDRQSLLLQFAKESGYIDTNRLENILHPERGRSNQDAAERKKSFKRGLLNPRRLPRQVGNSTTRNIAARDAMNRTAMPNAAALGVGLNGFDTQGVSSFADEQTGARFDEMLKTLNLN